MSTRKSTKKANALKAIAVFKGPVEGEVVITDIKGGVQINAFLPSYRKENMVFIFIRRVT